jgi:hypothetical protein
VQKSLLYCGDELFCLTSKTIHNITHMQQELVVGRLNSLRQQSTSGNFANKLSYVEGRLVKFASKIYSQLIGYMSYEREGNASILSTSVVLLNIFYCNLTFGL